MVNCTSSCSACNALDSLRENSRLPNCFFFHWLNLETHCYPYHFSLHYAPTQKESTNIIPSRFPLQYFLYQKRNFVCIVTRRCLLPSLSVSWTSGLCDAAGYLHWHCSFSGLATGGVCPILVPKVSRLLDFTFIPVSVLPTPPPSSGLRFWRPLLCRIPLSFNWFSHSRQNSLPFDSQSKTLQATSIPYNFSLRISHFFHV